MNGLVQPKDKAQKTEEPAFLQQLKFEIENPKSSSQIANKPQATPAQRHKEIKAEEAESKPQLPQFFTNEADRFPGRIRDNAALADIKYKAMMAARERNNSGEAQTPQNLNFMQKLHKMINNEYQQHNRTNDALYSRKELREVLQAMAPMVAGQFKNEDRQKTPRFSSYLLEKAMKLQDAISDLLPQPELSFSAIR